MLCAAAIVTLHACCRALQPGAWDAAGAVMHICAAAAAWLMVLALPGQIQACGKIDDVVPSVWSALSVMATWRSTSHGQQVNMGKPVTQLSS